MCSSLDCSSIHWSFAGRCEGGGKQCCSSRVPAFQNLVPLCKGGSHACKFSLLPVHAFSQAQCRLWRAQLSHVWGRVCGQPLATRVRWLCSGDLVTQPWLGSRSCQNKTMHCEQDHLCIMGQGAKCQDGRSAPAWMSPSLERMLKNNITGQDMPIAEVNVKLKWTWRLAVLVWKYLMSGHECDVGSVACSLRSCWGMCGWWSGTWKQPQKALAPPAVQKWVID